MAALNNDSNSSPDMPMRAARVAVHRMQKQFRQLFRQTIAETVDAAGDVDAEMRHLVTVLSRA